MTCSKIHDSATFKLGAKPVFNEVTSDVCSQSRLAIRPFSAALSIVLYISAFILPVIGIKLHVRTLYYICILAANASYIFPITMYRLTSYQLCNLLVSYLPII